MQKVKSTFYVKYEPNPEHAAMEVYQKIFNVDFDKTRLYDSENTIFWVSGEVKEELVVIQVGYDTMRVEVFKWEA